MNRPGLALGADALAAIEQHDWPGNVRDLRNRIKRAIVMTSSTKIKARDLGLDPPAGESALNIRAVRTDAEDAAVRRALAQSGHNISRAARLLGVSRPTLYDLMSHLGIRRKA